MPPHGGFAIGLERWTARLTGAANVREATLFPRDLQPAHAVIRGLRPGPISGRLPGGRSAAGVSSLAGSHRKPVGTLTGVQLFGPTTNHGSRSSSGS